MSDLAEVDLIDLEDSVPGPQLAALLCRAAGVQLLDEDANLGIVRIIELLGPFYVLSYLDQEESITINTNTYTQYLPTISRKY